MTRSVNCSDCCDIDEGASSFEDVLLEVGSVLSEMDHGPFKHLFTRGWSAVFWPVAPKHSPGTFVYGGATCTLPRAETPLIGAGMHSYLECVVVRRRSTNESQPWCFEHTTADNQSMASAEPLYERRLLLT